MNETGNDFLPILSSLPGPRGPAGAPGAPATAPAAPRTFAITTSAFTVPAVEAQVTVSVDDNTMFALGQHVYIAQVGYFMLTALPSAQSCGLTFMEVPESAAPGASIPAGRKVTAAGPSFLNTDVTDVLGQRVLALEGAPGNRNYYSAEAPAAGNLRVGDNWYDTNDGHRHYRWDGTAWLPANRVLELPDFGTGIRPIVKVSVLPTSGYSDGDFVWLTTDGKLYRRFGGSWTKAVATGDLTGQIDASTFIVDGTIIAQKLGAESVTADKIGANQIITKAANIGEAIITDAHITTISAGRITAGDIQSVNIGYAGRIFNPQCFDPAGSKATAVAAVEGGQVKSIAVQSGGSSYSATPPVLLTGGGGGSGATASAVVSNGVVTKVIVTNPGVGYTAAPSVEIAQHKSFRYFASVEFGSATKQDHLYTATTGFNFASQPPAVTAYGPGHPAWTPGATTISPAANGLAKVFLQASLIDHAGNITIYYRRNGAGGFTAMQAAESDDAGNARTMCLRSLSVNVTDKIEFFVAPCDGNGVLETPVTCRCELEVIFFNW